MMTESEVHALGTGLASRMSVAQLEAAMLLFCSLRSPSVPQNNVSIQQLRQTFFNHVKRCMRMPAGGAMAQGSQQTGFEMEMVTAEGASHLMRDWPNREVKEGGRRQSWELRSMEDLATHLELEKYPPAGWGALMGKPMPVGSGRTLHPGVILAGLPFTVSWFRRPDGTSQLWARFPIILYSDADATILPPDDSQGRSFYMDPPDQPGFHRDLFRTWGRRVAGELVSKAWPMSAALIALLPPEYQSDSENHLSDESSSASDA